MFNRYLSFLLLFVSVVACQRDSGLTPPKPAPPATYNDGGQSIHLALGNPSSANTNPDSISNLLLLKDQYVLSYNKQVGRPNWSSWHLQPSDMGSAQRKDDFRPDGTLPAGWYQVKPTDYTTADGFDRGHLCPSADRTATQTDNSATFLMTNIIPQAPTLNRGVWEELEAYCRELVDEGNELYIVAGGYGAGGTGSQGSKTTLATGNVQAPAHCWKVVVILPQGENDLSRINVNTSVIAVDMLNSQVVRAGWEDYIVTAADIEKATGYQFFTKLPGLVQNTLRVKKYKLATTTTPPASGTTTPPITVTTTAPVTVTTTTPVTVTVVTPPTTVTTTAPVIVTVVTPPTTVTITQPTTVTTTPPATGTTTAPSSPTTTQPQTGDPKCGTYNGKQLYRGPQGGCYYINSNGNKTYVDRSYCNC